MKSKIEKAKATLKIKIYHPPGSDGPMATALKKYNGGRVLVFVMGAFAEMPGDVTRIFDIIAHALARTHVSYYNGDAKSDQGHVQAAH